MKYKEILVITDLILQIEKATETVSFDSQLCKRMNIIQLILVDKSYVGCHMSGNNIPDLVVNLPVVSLIWRTLIICQNDCNVGIFHRNLFNVQLSRWL